jgi:hypothetical protein
MNIWSAHHIGLVHVDHYQRRAIITGKKNNYIYLPRHWSQKKPFALGDGHM